MDCNLNEKNTRSKTIDSNESNDISSYDILDLNKLKCKNINNKII